MPPVLAHATAHRKFTFPVLYVALFRIHRTRVACGAALNWRRHKTLQPGKRALGNRSTGRVLVCETDGHVFIARNNLGNADIGSLALFAGAQTDGYELSYRRNGCSPSAPATAFVFVQRANERESSSRSNRMLHGDRISSA